MLEIHLDGRKAAWAHPWDTQLSVGTMSRECQHAWGDTQELCAGCGGHLQKLRYCHPLGRLQLGGQLLEILEQSPTLQKRVQVGTAGQSLSASDFRLVDGQPELSGNKLVHIALEWCHHVSCLLWPGLYQGYTRTAEKYALLIVRVQSACCLYWVHGKAVGKPVRYSSADVQGLGCLGFKLGVGLRTHPDLLPLVVKTRRAGALDLVLRYFARRWDSLLEDIGWVSEANHWAWE